MTDAAHRLTTALADRYRIDRELGAGGMATVYLAEDLKHKRNVALKVLKPELAAMLGTERFTREIEITAGLTHPHILPVIDSGEADGFFFYVMPFVEGESLRERIDRDGQLSLEDALSIAEEVAEALQSAHNHGVVHRDIKPGNILLKEGRAYVADFGIARAVVSAGGDKLTATGVAMGTPAYMSPEQATGDARLDHRTDIFALGGVLYEMLAGEPPHSGPTAQAVIAKIIADSPTSLSTIRETVPPHVERAVHKALAKSAVDRFNSMQDFIDALKHPGEEPKERVPVTAGRTVRIGLAIVGVLAIAGVVWLTRNGDGVTLRHLQWAVADRDDERAYQLAIRMNMDHVPDSVWSKFTTPVTITSSPPGASVQRRPLDQPHAWEDFGKTPVRVERFPNSPSVLRLAMDGHRTVEAVTDARGADTIVLDPVATVSEGWRQIPGDVPLDEGGPEFAFRYVAPDLSLAPPLHLTNFQIARFEVTNAQYKAFVDAGGYADRSHWEHAFVRDGRTVSWEGAMQAFTDSTGRPGPGTWLFGSYRDGEADHPVTGVSWYEAAAYARFAGKDTCHRCTIGFARPRRGSACGSFPTAT